MTPLALIVVAPVMAPPAAIPAPVMTPLALIVVAPVMAPPAAIPAPVMTPLAVIAPHATPPKLTLPEVLIAFPGVVPPPAPTVSVFTVDEPVGVLTVNVPTPLLMDDAMMAPLFSATPPMVLEVLLELEMFPLEVTWRTTPAEGLRLVKYQFAFDALKLVPVFDAAMMYAAPLVVS
jgi:hypothetical protein